MLVIQKYMFYLSKSYIHKVYPFILHSADLSEELDLEQRVLKNIYVFFICLF